MLTPGACGSAAGKLRERRVRLLARNPADAADATRHFSGLAHINARAGSTVEFGLALRSGFPAQAWMPPTARPALRGERLGLPVLTAGPAMPLRRSSHRPGGRAQLTD